MTNAEWIDTLQRIPEDDRNKTVLVLLNGSELTVDTFFRFDNTFLIVRGRAGGSIDENRAFVIPYSNLLYFRLEKIVKIEELAAAFGPATPKVELVAEVPVAEVVPVVSATPTPAPHDSTLVHRNAILERLRAVRAAGGKPGVSGVR